MKRQPPPLFADATMAMRKAWIGPVILLVVVDGMLWFAGFRSTHHPPQLSAALVGAASGVLVALVGILSASFSATESHRNSLRLFAEQSAEERKTRHNQDLLQAFKPLLEFARRYPDATSAVDEAKVALTEKRELHFNVRGNPGDAIAEKEYTEAMSNYVSAENYKHGLMREFAAIQATAELLGTDRTIDAIHDLAGAINGSREKIEDARIKFCEAARIQLQVVDALDPATQSE